MKRDVFEVIFLQSLKYQSDKVMIWIMHNKVEGSLVIPMFPMSSYGVEIGEETCGSTQSRPGARRIRTPHRSFAETCSMKSTATIDDW